MSDQKADAVRDTVREGYSEIAEMGQWSGVRPASRRVVEAEGSGCCGGGSGEGGGCCGPVTLTADDVAVAVGYAKEDLASLPEGANMGLSCGNPTALASLVEGEVVVDLGSGGGFDCFLAGPKVGASGRVIGVDMTPAMLSKARGNIESYRKQSALDNVEFRLGEIEHLPIADGVVDVVISNCVINLSTDKGQVWREIARVLKPGGRAAVSDIALLRPLPEAVRANAEALVGCVAGAELVEDVLAAIESAGMVEVKQRAKPEYIEAMVNAEDPLYQKIAAALPEGAKISDYIVSLDVEAKKG
ncbi:arsenite methyltransferase [Mucisphaera calidilacus]|uniref:Arsenite methyltransferase n=1 Tax=Mucisphaera calidilacus TaxID=2527982 RepID=A0A518C1B2_9BACT|nr:arsenite methyltransferase [Mucisphaera calidilacus]QDU73015.1 Ubiquinone/menaquinone biosynthesis C-methyltransferase UbiE [Mucisphaera calidilacus]